MNTRKILSIAVMLVLSAAAISVADYTNGSSGDSQVTASNITNSLGNLSLQPSPLVTEYKVFFNETGLPTGTQWSVNVSGALHTSTNSSIAIFLPTGSYSYVAANPLEFYSPDPSGNFNVSSGNTNILIGYHGRLSATGYVNLYSKKLVNSTSDLSTNQAVFPVYGIWDNFSNDLVALGYFNSMVYLVDQSNLSVISGFPGPSSPIAVDYNPLDGNLYILNSTTVFMYNSSGFLLDSQYLGSYLISVAYDPANGELMVGNLSGGLFFLNAGSLSVVGSIDYITVFGSQSFAYNQAMNMMEVVNDSSPNGNIVYFNGNHEPVLKISTAGRIVSIAYDPATNSTYYVGLAGGLSNVYVLNTTGSHIIAGTGESYGIAYSQPLNSVIVTNTQNGTVELINASTNLLTYVISGNGIPILPITGYNTTDFFIVNPTEDALDVITENNFAVNVNFHVQGIPSGAEWNVSIGNVRLNSTGTNITFIETPGDYSYTVSQPHGFVGPTSGDFSLGEQALNITLAFQKGYSLTFNESGLPANTAWGIDLNGTISEANSGLPISLTVANGTYHFNVTGQTGYDASPASGYVIVSGTQRTVDINFSPVSYEIDFVSLGLPAGTTWKLFVNGVMQETNRTSVEYPATPGTYNYSIPSVQGFYPQISSSTVYVTDQNITVQVNWLPYLYRVNFNETGLPLGTEWTVSVDGYAPVSSSGNNLTEYIQNGSYSYAFISSNSSWIGGSGSFNISGSGVMINVAYAPVLFKVTFVESGLSGITYWSVMVTDHGSAGTYDNSTSLYLQNGSYSYSAETSNSSFAPVHGSFIVAGSSDTVEVPFTLLQYNVTFRESGLANNTSWGVYIPGSGNYSSTGAMFNVSLSIGQHSYSPLAVPGYNSTPGMYFDVANGNLTILVNFTKLPSPLQTYTLTIFELGLPEGYSWEIKLNQTVEESYPGGYFTLQLVNGTYNLSILSIDPQGKTYVGIDNLTLKVNGADQYLYVLFYGPYVWLIIDFSFCYHSHDHNSTGNHDNVSSFSIAKNIVTSTRYY